MWLKQLLERYSRGLANQPKPKVWEPQWVARQGVSSVEVSERFKNEVMVPLVQRLNRDLDLSLRMAPGGGSVPHFRLLGRSSELVGAVYMANPFNGRGFFQYPNRRTVELHSYSFLLNDLREQLAIGAPVERAQQPEQAAERGYHRRGR